MLDSPITTREDVLIKHVRESLSLALLHAAQERKISINSNNLAYVLHNGVTVVGAPVKGIEDLAKGANVALLYLSSPASKIPEDYYLLRVVGTKQKATAELIGSKGVVEGNTSVVIADAKPTNDTEKGFKLTGLTFNVVTQCVNISFAYTTESGVSINVTVSICAL